VPVEPLDDLVEGDVDLVKIDVEGGGLDDLPRLVEQLRHSGRPVDLLATR
jgi:hypothetical protein